MSKKYTRKYKNKHNKPLKTVGADNDAPASRSDRGVICLECAERGGLPVAASFL